jgi:hypothetical protein
MIITYNLLHITEITLYSSNKSQLDVFFCLLYENIELNKGLNGANTVSIVVAPQIFKPLIPELNSRLFITELPFLD